MIRFSFLSLILILLGCATSRPMMQPTTSDVTCIQKFIPEFQSTWYNTSVDVVGKHLSGLVLFKKMEDQSQRIVFTNEAGIKFFDFGIEPNGNFTVYQVLDKLNKEAVINSFRKDFELLLMTKFTSQSPQAFQRDSEVYFGMDEAKETDYAISNIICTQLNRLEKWGRKKKMTEITFQGVTTTPDSIQIQHFNFEMTIKMRKINH